MKKVEFEKAPLLQLTRETVVDSSKFIFGVFAFSTILSILLFFVAFLLLSGVAQIALIFSNVILISIAIFLVYSKSNKVKKQRLNFYSDFAELSAESHTTQSAKPDSESPNQRVVRINYNEISHVHFSRANRLTLTDRNSNKIIFHTAEALEKKDEILKFLKSGDRLFSVLNEDHTLTYSKEVAAHLFLQDPNSDISSLTIQKSAEGDLEVYKNDKELVAYIENDDEILGYPGYLLFDAHSEELVMTAKYRDLIIDTNGESYNRVKLDIFDAEGLMVAHALRYLTENKADKRMDIQIGNDKLRWNIEQVVFEEVILTEYNDSKSFNVKYNAETGIYRIDSERFKLPTYLSMMIALMAVAINDYYPAEKLAVDNKKT